MLSKDMNIEYILTPTKDVNFNDNFFDIITACQYFWYFNHKKVMPKLYDILKENGSIFILYMAWIPLEDKITVASEELVLKYNPKWNGSKETMYQIDIPDCYKEKFRLVYHEEYPVKISFTRGI